MARICPLIPLVSSEVETPRRRARPMGISTSLDANGHKMTAKSALLRAIRKSCKLRPFFYIGAHLAPTPRSEEHTAELKSLMRSTYAVFCLKNKTHKEYEEKQTTN